MKNQKYEICQLYGYEQDTIDFKNMESIFRRNISTISNKIWPRKEDYKPSQVSKLILRNTKSKEPTAALMASDPFLFEKREITFYKEKLQSHLKLDKDEFEMCWRACMSDISILRLLASDIQGKGLGSKILEEYEILMRRKKKKVIIAFIHEKNVFKQKLVSQFYIKNGYNISLLYPVYKNISLHDERNSVSPSAWVAFKVLDKKSIPLLNYNNKNTLRSLIFNKEDISIDPGYLEIPQFPK